MNIAVDEPEVIEPPNRALWLAGAATAIVAIATGLFVFDSAAAAWVAGIAAVLVAFGVFAPHRGGVSLGVLMFATASLVASNDMSLASQLIVNGLVAVAVVAVLVIADLSFVARRATLLSPIAVQGFVAVHVVTTVVGVAGAAATVGAVLAVEWPRWLIVVPAVLLAGSAVVLMRLVRRYQSGMNVIPQPPPPTGLPGQGPPPPTSSAPTRNQRSTRPQPPPPLMPVPARPAPPMGAGQGPPPPPPPRR